MHRVRVDNIRPEKDGQIAQHVTDDEKDEHDASDGDDGFLADRGKQPGDRGVRES